MYFQVTYNTQLSYKQDRVNMNLMAVMNIVVPSPSCPPPTRMQTHSTETAVTSSWLP